MMARWLRLLAVAALVVALGLAAAYAARRFGPAGDGTVQVTGTLEARQVDVSAKIAGRISSLLVNAGQAVTKGEIIALLDFPDLEAEARLAEAALRTAEAQLKALGAGPRVQEFAAARADLKAAQERLELLMAGPRPDAVAGARARVAEARAALALAEGRIREGKIVSPLTGVVLRKNLEAGEMANPGVPIVTLVDPSDMWVRAYVPEAEVGRIRLGEPAQVTVDAFPGRAFPGKITEIASEAEF